MAKNSMAALVKMYKPVLEERTTAIYGGFALALHQTDIPSDQIIALMEMTDKIWNQSITEGWDITERVREEVGIDIRNEVVKSGS